MFGTASLVAARITQKQDHRRGKKWLGGKNVEFEWRTKERSSLHAQNHYPSFETVRDESSAKKVKELYLDVVEAMHLEHWHRGDTALDSIA